jgi:adenylate cyclase
MRVRSKLLLAISVPVGLLVLQILTVSYFVRELQSAVTFIALTHETIEDDFVAQDLIAEMRIEVKNLPSLYVSGTADEGQGMNRLMILFGQLQNRIAPMIRSAELGENADESLLAISGAFDDVAGQLTQTAQVLAEDADMNSLLQQAIFVDKSLSDLLRALDVLAIDLRKQLQIAVDRERSIHNLPIIAGIAIGGLTIVMLLVFTWLVVDRYFVTRLTALSKSMLAISTGDLRAQLPQPSGRDEVAEMAMALKVFRDTAVEVEENNLREVAQARQRLVDAIESISEGFSLYDAQDRLVLANTRYRKLVATGPDDQLATGTMFEDVIRAAAREGIIEDADGQVDDWVASRLDRHSNPRGAFVQRHKPGRWIEVTEYKTSDGSTVATYADITIQKQAELDLLDAKRRTEEANEEVTGKNKMLESLSVQLSKYLSPQVYSSIFSGEQTVELASKRKKLTIMFSDIAGFTETADQLESEELTGLLNNYLTEMSDIALEFGATIDKYIGDAIMVFFGDPETRGPREDALACVKMAIRMQERMIDLQQAWRDRGIEKPFQMRIGINTGYCTVGNFGSQDRMDYTIIGSEVNLAARLQTMADPGQVVIAHETYALVKHEVHAVEGTPKKVKGFNEPVRNYVVALQPSATDQTTDRFSANREGFQVSLDLDGMSDSERAQARKDVRALLGLLEREGPNKPD